MKVIYSKAKDEINVPIAEIYSNLFQSSLYELLAAFELMRFVVQLKVQKPLVSDIIIGRKRVKAQGLFSLQTIFLYCLRKKVRQLLHSSRVLPPYQAKRR